MTLKSNKSFCIRIKGKRITGLDCHYNVLGLALIILQKLVEGTILNNGI